MSKYYRYTQTTNVMSDYGHAMFADTNTKNENGYGDNCWTYDGLKGVEIETLKKDIMNAWNEGIENGFNFCDNYLETLDAETVYNTFNPSDIVDSAEAWDDATLVTWIWENVLESKNIDAVLTFDGAIVFDADLCQLVED